MLISATNAELDASVISFLMPIFRILETDLSFNSWLLTWESNFVIIVSLLIVARKNLELSKVLKHLEAHFLGFFRVELGGDDVVAVDAGCKLTAMVGGSCND